jgi:hypothetical protein
LLVRLAVTFLKILLGSKTHQTSEQSTSTGFFQEIVIVVIDNGTLDTQEMGYSGNSF